MKKISLICLFFMTLNCFATAEFKITRSMGEILINGEKPGKHFPLQTGDIIEAIGKKSFVQIKSSYGSIFLVRDGKLKLEEFTEEKSTISLIRGKFFHFFNNPKSSKRTFSVKTKNSILGVRGTKYMVSSTDKKDYLCVCEGEVSAQKIGDTKEYLVTNGQDLDLYTGKTKPIKRKASKDMMTMATDEFKLMGYPVY